MPRTRLRWGNRALGHGDGGPRRGGLIHGGLETSFPIDEKRDAKVHATVGVDQFCFAHVQDGFRHGIYAFIIGVSIDDISEEVGVVLVFREDFRIIPQTPVVNAQFGGLGHSLPLGHIVIGDQALAACRAAVFDELEFLFSRFDPLRINEFHNEDVFRQEFKISLDILILGIGGIKGFDTDFYRFGRIERIGDRFGFGGASVAATGVSVAGVPQALKIMLNATSAIKATNNVCFFIIFSPSKVDFL